MSWQPDSSGPASKEKIPSSNFLADTDPTVLIVDDESVLVDLLQRFLELQNIRCKGFTSSREATAWHKDHWQEVSLAILDLKLGHDDGQVCFEELKKTNPHIKAAFLSGFIDNNTEQALLNAGAMRFFQKPLRYPDLVSWVRGVISNGKNATM